MSDKQDLILTMLYELKPVVEDSYTRIKGMEEAVNQATIRNAEQDIHITTLRERIGHHLANHWAWVGMMAGGLGIIGVAIEIWRKRP